MSRIMAYLGKKEQTWRWHMLDLVSYGLHYLSITQILDHILRTYIHYPSIWSRLQWMISLDPILFKVQNKYVVMRLKSPID